LGGMVQQQTGSITNPTFSPTSEHIMAAYNLTPELREQYTQELTQDPLKWTCDSIREIDEMIDKNSHDFNPYKEVFPDEWVKSNQTYLENIRDLFKELDLSVPNPILETISKAKAFVKG